MPACIAYELTLIIGLIIFVKSKQETAKSVIMCVYAGLYVHFGIHLAWNKSPHSSLNETNTPINY